MTYANADAVIAISFIFPVLGVTAVALRFWSRCKQKAGIAIDDWLMIPALLVEFAIAAILLWGAFEKSLGYNTPVDPNSTDPQSYLFYMSPQQWRFQRIQYLCNIFNPLAYGLIKLSILFFYRRIFCSSRSRSGSKKFDIATKATITVTLLWTIAFVFGAVFLCGTHWDAHNDIVAVVAVKCPAQLRFLLGFAISDFITDLIILILPIPKIWKLQMPLHQKIAVTSIFLVGLVALAASATRMAIYSIYIVDAFSQPDGEILITILLFWSMIELGTGLVVACLPTLRPRLAHLSPYAIVSSIKDRLSSFSSSRSKSSRDSYTISKPMNGSYSSSEKSERGWYPSQSGADVSISTVKRDSESSTRNIIPRDGIVVETNIDLHTSHV